MVRLIFDDDDVDERSIDPIVIISMIEFIDCNCCIRSTALGLNFDAKIHGPRNRRGDTMREPAVAKLQRSEQRRT